MQKSPTAVGRKELVLANWCVKAKYRPVYLFSSMLGDVLREPPLIQDPWDESQVKIMAWY